MDLQSLKNRYSQGTSPLQIAEGLLKVCQQQPETFLHVPSAEEVSRACQRLESTPAQDRYDIHSPKIPVHMLCSCSSWDGYLHSVVVLLAALQLVRQLVCKRLEPEVEETAEVLHPAVDQLLKENTDCSLAVLRLIDTVQLQPLSFLASFLLFGTQAPSSCSRAPSTTCHKPSILKDVACPAWTLQALVSDYGRQNHSEHIHPSQQQCMKLAAGAGDRYGVRSSQSKTISTWLACPRPPRAPPLHTPPMPAPLWSQRCKTPDASAWERSTWISLPRD